MEERIRLMDHNEFVGYINYLAKELETYLKRNKLKVDYLVPVMRSGLVPAVYLANKLNIVKFAPFQVKHITYKDKAETIEILFNPLSTINVGKKNPVFLVVDGVHCTGTSVELCINEIYEAFPSAKILYVCIAKVYGSKEFKDQIDFEMSAYERGENLSVEECRKLGVDPDVAIFPWETIEGETKHPDDLEENIFF